MSMTAAGGAVISSPLHLASQSASMPMRPRFEETFLAGPTARRLRPAGHLLDHCEKNGKFHSQDKLSEHVRRRSATSKGPEYASSACNCPTKWL